MGEFAIDTRTGKRVKLGCQYHMEYISYEKMKAALPYLERDPGCGFPEDYFKEPMSTYWRFPFPDEKKLHIYEQENIDHSRTEDFIISPEFAKELVGWVEKKKDFYFLSIGLQKEHEGYLIPVFEVTEHPNPYSISGEEHIHRLVVIILKSAVKFECEENRLNEIVDFCAMLLFYSRTPISELIKPEKLSQLIV